MALDVTALNAKLPEDILKKKWAGDFEGALAAIESQLAGPLPAMARQRLLLEREILPRLARQYPHTRDQALQIMQGLIPGFSMEELKDLERQGWLDFLYIQGEKHYFTRFHRTLLKVHPGIASRAGQPLSPASPLLDEAVKIMGEAGGMALRLRVKTTLRIEDGAFLPGETYRVHLPLPIPCAQTEEIRFLGFSPDPAFIAPKDHPQRTVFFEKKLMQNEPFSAEYEYVSAMRCADLARPPKGPLYPNCPAPGPEDLQELPPHIRFTPYIQSLLKEIVAEEAQPLAQARKIYDFITTKVRYSFVRSYLTIEDHVGYAAENLKGDCGLQALLFITLCRACGIPARWQSGLCAGEGDTLGSHDWAQFYLEPWGWLFCDCSFGGSAFRKGNMERWNFYFGNLDPWRMVANNAYQAALTPKKHFLRADPYDNQNGECEHKAGGLDGYETDTEHRLVAWERVPDFRAEG